ncbi:MAG: Beta-ketothiolase BktB [Syntrophorhabdaceae bacterium PtaU1.Bin034]|jgi:acetyl-CoA acetyltransferase family protein|nr:MAG: Beta-ketothiolase BktB [Syntrophorhabdaceae bacterium PtaU1.Bin034]
MDNFKNAYVPYKGYYSTPFCRWQGSMQNENAIELGANTARRWFETKKYDPTIIDYLYFGITIPQHHVFYGHTWSGAILTDDKKYLPGLLIHQACSTSTTALQLASLAIDHGALEVAFGLMVDRCSNGAHTVWAQPLGPGGEVESENWMMDNFEGDPRVRTKMLRTAENVSKEMGFTKEEADAMVLRRYEQYRMALANDREFQKRYMFPAEIKLSKKQTRLVDQDEGATVTTAEGLARLKPVEPGGIHSFGAQTFPADGNCGFLVTTRDKAKELSDDPGIEIKIVSYGFARVKPGYMPAAPVPAAEMALANAGLKISDMKAIKSHNPFAANDLNFAKKMGVDVMKMNNYGCSLIYGHPQAPTAGRIIIEMWEEMAILGGGYCLFTGCAAGDTAASMIFKVG